jgi:CheY-like chemotaxis protein
MQEQQISNKNLSFNVSIDDNVPDLLIGDSLRIKQVVLNLLGNAIKFTERGGVDLAVSVAERSGIRVLLDIAVKDTGIGISGDLHERIFEPFVQGSTHNHNGAGLGLAISRSLAGLMGGAVRLESQPETGSTFHLLIPLKRKLEDLSEMDLERAEPLQWRGPALRVLLVEDNPINSHFMTVVMENMGHVITHAENGKVALEALKANNFELVLMDIEMPVMNGVDSLRALRHLEQFGGKSLKVIAMTAYALMGDKDKYLKMGFDGYVSKPFVTKELVDELMRVVPS